MKIKIIVLVSLISFSCKGSLLSRLKPLGLIAQRVGYRYITRSAAEELFGLSRGYSRDDICTAYKGLVLKHHPDVGGDESQFKLVQEAYDSFMGRCVFDPEKEEKKSGGSGNCYSEQSWEEVFTEQYYERWGHWAYGFSDNADSHKYDRRRNKKKKCSKSRKKQHQKKQAKQEQRFCGSKIRKAKKWARQRPNPSWSDAQVYVSWMKSGTIKANKSLMDGLLRVYGPCEFAVLVARWNVLKNDW